MAAAVFAVAGGGFIVATLVMARVLDEYQFSWAVVMIALCNVAVAAAPAGVNGIALRHDRRTDSRLLFYGGASVLVAALGAGLMARVLYGLPLFALVVLEAAILAGGIALLTRSAFQRAMALQRMIVLSQIPNIALLLAAGLMLLGIGRVHWFPTLVVAVTYLVIGAYAWRWVAKNQRDGPPIDGALRRDALNFGGLAFAGEGMMQLERLLVPVLLGEAELAVYAVVAAAALSPYRMLEMGTIATLVARLRNLQDAAQRLRMLRKEIILLLSLCIAGGALIVLIAPPLCELVLEHRRVSTALVLAVVLGGITRVCCAFAHSIALAFCEGPQLRLVNAGNWLAILVGAALAVLLSPLGLVWIIYGVTGGWVCKTALSARLGIRQMQASAPVRA